MAGLAAMDDPKVRAALDVAKTAGGYVGDRERIEVEGEAASTSSVMRVRVRDGCVDSVWVPEASFARGDRVVDSVVDWEAASPSRTVARMRARRLGRDQLDLWLGQGKDDSLLADDERAARRRGRAVADAKMAAVRGRVPDGRDGHCFWVDVFGEGHRGRNGLRAKVLAVREPNGLPGPLWVPAVVDAEGFIAHFGAVEGSLREAVGAAWAAHGLCARGLRLGRGASLHSRAGTDGPVAGWEPQEGAFHVPDVNGNDGAWTVDGGIDAAADGSVDGVRYGLVAFLAEGGPASGEPRSFIHHPILVDVGGSVHVKAGGGEADCESAVAQAKSWAEGVVGDWTVEASLGRFHAALDGSSEFPEEAMSRAVAHLNWDSSVVPLTPRGARRRTVDLLNWALDPNHRVESEFSSPPDCMSFVLGTFIEAVERVLPRFDFNVGLWRDAACAAAGTGREREMEMAREEALRTGLSDWRAAQGVPADASALEVRSVGALVDWLRDGLPSPATGRDYLAAVEAWSALVESACELTPGRDLAL